MNLVYTSNNQLEIELSNQCSHIESWIILNVSSSYCIVKVTIDYGLKMCSTKFMKSFRFQTVFWFKIKVSKFYIKHDLQTTLEMHLKVLTNKLCCSKIRSHKENQLLNQEFELLIWLHLKLIYLALKRLNSDQQLKFWALKFSL